MVKRTLIVAVIILLALPAAAQAAYPGHNGRIAFVRGGSIYTVKPDGSGLRRLSYGTDDNGPTWSPDGKRIAFTRQSQVWTMSARGGQPTQVTTARGWSADPTWSPDGRWVAFDRLVNNVPALLRIRSTRPFGHPVVITATTAECDLSLEPSWSVVGIAYIHDTCNPDGLQHLHLDLISPQGRPIRDLGPCETCNLPAVSPRGHAVLYDHVILLDGNMSTEIDLMDIQTQTSRVVTSTPGDNVFAPSWAPNGRRIVYTTFGFDANLNWTGTLWISRPDGTDAHILITNAANVDWQPLH